MEDKFTVHWSSGPVVRCREHAKELVKLGAFLSVHVPVTSAPDDVPCDECVRSIEQQGKEGK